MRYERLPDGTAVAPRVFIDVSNRAADDLYVAVLDLTDRFRCHVVFPTTSVTGGHTVALWDRRPIPVELPPDRPLRSGAAVRDWLKVVVSDVDFDATSADLPPLDEPVTRSAAERLPRTTLERLFATRRAPRHRHRRAAADGRPLGGHTVTIETTVP